MFHRFDCHCDDIVIAAAQFVLYMDSGCGDKSVNTKGFGDFQGFCRGINVFRNGSRKGTNTAIFDVFSDGLYRFKIARRGNRETCFDNIYP
ncbi:Uncharacterised protein [Vibrio cholerae]|nr:Uncharacterised protein [Vibrio cholerae]